MVQESASMLSTTEELDAGEAQQLMAHPLPYWVERMTVCYLHAYGGKVERRGRTWDLTWPHGASRRDVVFAARDADWKTTAQHLTIEEPLVRGLVMRLHRRLQISSV